MKYCSKGFAFGKKEFATEELKHRIEPVFFSVLLCFCGKYQVAQQLLLCFLEPLW